MSASEPDNNNADLERVMHIVEEGLARSKDEGEEDEDLRLDTFAVVCVWAWRDEDGNDNEGYSIWSESRRTHVQAGILVAGLQRLSEGGGTN